jgi:hypothetical protein
VSDEGREERILEGGELESMERMEEWFDDEHCSGVD